MEEKGRERSVKSVKPRASKVASPPVGDNKIYVYTLCLKITSGAALMIQSYLVTEEDNERLNANPETFSWLVTALDGAMHDRRWHGFSVIEIITVAQTQFQPTFCCLSSKLNLFSSPVA